MKNKGGIAGMKMKPNRFFNAILKFASQDVNDYL